MMAIGIGCRKGTAPEVILAVITEALQKQGIGISRPLVIATGGIKADEEGIREAAQRLLATFVVTTDEAMRAVAIRTLTHSDVSFSYTGLPSLSEAAALAAAGPSAHLVGPRHVSQGVACAIAISENSP